jgi:hypothetical protein
MQNNLYRIIFVLTIIGLFFGCNVNYILGFPNPNDQPLDKNDQQQTEASSEYCIYWPNKLAQSFKPTLDRLTRVHLSISKIGNPSNLIVSIRSDFDESDLTSVIIPSEFLDHYPRKELIDCNLPDINVVPEQTYYIIFKHESESSIADSLCWWYSSNAPYERGTGWYWTVEGGSKWVEGPFDFCFKTYGYNSGENQPPNTPSKPLGPIYGIVNTSYIYSTSTIDIDDDDIRYGWDWNGDDAIDDWTGFHPSGNVVNFNHSWKNPGYYNVQVNAEDENGIQSSFSSKLEVRISNTNHPPDIPSNPNPNDGASNVNINTDLSWFGGDPDEGDIVTYDVYFGSMLPLPKVSSNQTHTTYDPGTLHHDLTYFWNIVAWDNYGASTDGPSWHFTTGVGNHPPGKPRKPSGPLSGKSGLEYTYLSNTTDLDGNLIYFLYDWDDGTNSGWKGPYKSDETCTASHIWNEKGYYKIKVKAKDIYDTESEWSDSLSVSMPKNNLEIKKLLILRLLTQIIKRFPFIAGLQNMFC